MNSPKSDDKEVVEQLSFDFGPSDFRKHVCRCKGSCQKTVQLELPLELFEDGDS